MVNDIERETKKSRVWDAQLFADYLIAMGKSKDFTLQSREFPTEIQVDEQWEKSFGFMRNQHIEGNEYEWIAPIGVDTSAREVIVSRKAYQEKMSNITPRLIQHAMEGLKSKREEITLIGDIRSHPRKFWIMEYEKARWLTGDEMPTPVINPKDYFALIGEHPASVLGVVDGNFNFLAFRSHETKTADDMAYLGNKSSAFESFRNYWMMRSETAEQMMKDIAREHHIVIYKGYKDLPLIKQRF